MVWNAPQARVVTHAVCLGSRKNGYPAYWAPVFIGDVSKHPFSANTAFLCATAVDGTLDRYGKELMGMDSLPPGMRERFGRGSVGQIAKTERGGNEVCHILTRRSGQDTVRAYELFEGVSNLLTVKQLYVTSIHIPLLGSDHGLSLAQSAETILTALINHPHPKHDVSLHVPDDSSSLLAIRAYGVDADDWQSFRARATQL